MDVVGQLATRRSPAEVPPSTSTHRHHCSSAGWRLAVASIFGGLGLLVWVGSNRLPADPTQPLELRGRVADAGRPRGTVRVATINIHGGKGDDDCVDLDRTAGCLDGLDFVGLNEVRAEWFGFRENQAAQLGRKLEMAWLFVPTERRWWHDHFGNGLLSTVALTGLHRIPLPGTQSRKYRTAVLASFPAGSRNQYNVHVLLVHIDRARDREMQLQAVIDLFLSLKEPTILMGDLNTRAGDPRLQRLLSTPGVRDAVADGLNGGPPSGRCPPAERIDWIITRGCRCVRAGCRPTDASDHPLVWAELQIGTAAENSRPDDRSITDP